MNPLLSGGLLAASMLLGQTPEPPPKIVVPAPPPSMQPAPPTQRPIIGFFNREDRPILNKIQSWFKRDQPDANHPNGLQGKDKVIRETAPPPMIPLTPAGSSDFPRKLPNPTSKAATTPEPLAQQASQGAKGIEQTTLKPDAGANLKAAKSSPIRAAFADRIGRDEKFEWITGQFEIENGTHVLYYATPETIDKFNGRIVLQAQQGILTQFSRGDLVSVRGDLVQAKTAQGMAPAYRVATASLIERAKR